MTSFDGGTVQAHYTIDYSQAQQAAAQIKALYQGVQQQAGQGAAIRAPAGAGDLAAVYVRQQQAAARLEAQQSTLARARGEDTGATALLAQAQERLMALLVRENLTFEQTIAVSRQLASVQTQVARSSAQAAAQQSQLTSVQTQATRAAQQSAGAAQQFGESFKSGLLGIVGPVAVASTAIGGLTSVVRSFGDAFVFKATLDASSASLKSALTGFRDVGATIAEAAQFGRQFNITQEQTNSILASSIDVLKQSSGSVTELETALLRLQTRDVSKPISEAARAVRELQSGDVTSIKELFNVPAKDALEMKNAIAGGADSIQVLTAWLDKAGVGMDALAQRTTGAMGKMHELAVAQEDLVLAQAAFAQGPGLTLLEGKISVIRGATRLLSGDVETMGQSLANASVAFGASSAGAQAYFNALASGQGVIAAQAAANAAATAATDLLTQAHRDGGGGTFAFATATNALVGSMSAESAAAAQAATDLAALRAEFDKSAQASVLDAAKKDLQSAATSRLDFATKTAADAFLALNPKLDASQAFAAAAAAGLGPLVAEVIRLRAEANNTRAALLGERIAAVNAVAGRSTERDDLQREKNADRAAALTAGRAKAQAAAAASDKARTDQLIRTGTQTQVVAQRQREYNDAVTKFGASSAQAITAQTTLIEAQQSAAKIGGAGRVSAAQSTALALNNVEQNSGLQLAKTQRENLERLRDQQEDFDVGRVRDQEDFARQRLRLLAQGQRGQAARLSDDFKRDQQREQEDFDRQRRRTLRNNQEGVGDIGARADLRTAQIGDRAALRGVRVPGGALPSDIQPLPSGATQALPAAAQTLTLRVQIAPTSVQIDGHTIVELTWPEVEQRFDTELSASLAQIGIPGSGQSAVAGVG